MKRGTKRLICTALAGVMLLGMTGCGGNRNEVTEAGNTEASGTEAKTEAGVTQAAGETASNGSAPTITFYPSAANLSSGLVGGYKGEFFASRGFALDVWAYSDEKTNAILASGDLPDVMFIPENSLDIMIESGMLLNLDEYLDDMPHLKAYEPMETAIK